MGQVKKKEKNAGRLARVFFVHFRRSADLFGDPFGQRSILLRVKFRRAQLAMAEHGSGSFDAILPPHLRRVQVADLVRVPMWNFGFLAGVRNALGVRS
jgi:hypothetical protein